MSIRYRPMRPKEVAQCVEIVAADPALGPRYGKWIDQLGCAWLRVLREPAFRSCVFEETGGESAKLLGVATSAFVSNEFVHHIKFPLGWIGPELTRQVVSGQSPLLSLREIQRANTVGGLNVVVWPSCLLPGEQKRTEVTHAVMSSLMEYHRGYLLKELIVQATNVEEVKLMTNMGGLFQGSGYVGYASTQRTPEDVVKRPHLFGVTRDMSYERMGTWASAVFYYRIPRLALRPSHQTLVRAALRALTDEELSSELGISLSAVKKAWGLIYQRVDDCKLDLFKDEETEKDAGDRGRGKKHKLLAYLREHPEELRPFSLKLLQEQWPGEPAWCWGKSDRKTRGKRKPGTDGSVSTGQRS